MLSPWMKIFSKYFSIIRRNWPQCLWSRFTQDLHLYKHVKLRHKDRREKLADPVYHDWKQVSSSES